MKNPDAICEDNRNVIACDAIAVVLNNLKIDVVTIIRNIRFLVKVQGAIINLAAFFHLINLLINQSCPKIVYIGLADDHGEKGFIVLINENVYDVLNGKDAISKLVVDEHLVVVLDNLFGENKVGIGKADAKDLGAINLYNSEPCLKLL